LESKYTVTNNFSYIFEVLDNGVINHESLLLNKMHSYIFEVLDNGVINHEGLLLNKMHSFYIESLS